jgi:catechol 2,3-dioxygenase-like lactoylglutathione lyase family enzyme
MTTPFNFLYAFHATGVQELEQEVEPRDCVAMIDHVSIQCADVAASARFYDAVLATLGGQRIFDFGEVLGYGVPPMPDFWLGPQRTGEGFRELHLAFSAPTRAAVQAFFDAATAAGAEALHEPRVWPEYHEQYFGAFVRDPDGNNVEAVCHGPE